MLTLVPFTTAHFPLLSAWFESQRDVVQWGGPALTHPLTDDQFEAMLEEGVASPPARLCWMVADDAGFIGHAQLVFDWQSGSARLSRVAIAPDARGRGLAAPMLRLVIDQAFAFAGIERVSLFVYDFNVPAIRTYERLGFRMEGVRLSSARVGDECWNTATMGLPRSAWAEAARKAG